MRSLTAVMAPAPPAVGGGGGLFVDHKKGEIPELKNLLRDSAVDKDPKHKRAVMERVVGYMTLGIDMSPLFSEMIMATATKDLVQKKMCYLYLSNYASLQPEMALLVINTLQKDARDQDPMVRGLALRCLCSLHVENVLEYLIDPVLKGLQDVSGYVRKTAVMCVLRLRELSPDVIADRQLVHELFYLLNDRDPQVAANAVQAILELQGEAGVRLLCNKEVVVALLKRLRDFNEWSQCLILKVVAEFKAESAEEAFEIMNFLDERLRHCNAAIVVATVKVFFNLSADNPAIQKQAIERTKGPLVSLMTAASSEVAFVLLKHMHLLVQHAPGVYDDEFSSFFVRYSDALYVQNIKIKMLALLTNDTNFMSIVDELSALVSPHDATLSKVAIQALGDIAVRRGRAAPLVADKICTLLGRPWGQTNKVLQNECISAAKDILRKFPPLSAILLPVLTDSLSTVEPNTPAQVALVWVLGQFASDIPEAPYLLEGIIADWDATQSAQLRVELLTATVKVFLQRPPETQAMLGRLLKAAVADAANVDVHDRGLLYYRLLSVDAATAKRVVMGKESEIAEFVDQGTDEMKDRLMESFASLSVVYRMPEQRWMSEAALAAMHKIADPHVANTPLSQLQALPPSTRAPPPPPTPAPAHHHHQQASAAQSQPSGSAAGGRVGGGAVRHTHHALVSDLQLDASLVLSPDQFQAMWLDLGVADTVELALMRVPEAAFIEAAFVGNGLKIAAHGSPAPNLHKFFVYGTPQGGAPVLCEATLEASTSRVSGAFKSPNPGMVPAFVEHFRVTLSLFMAH